MLLVEAFLILVCVAMTIRVASFGAVRRLATRALPKRPQRAGSRRISVEEARWAIIALSRRLEWCNCLVRSLALQALLRRVGVDSELRIGVRRGPASGFEAHAWIECGPETLLPDGSPELYHPLPRPQR